MSAVPDEAMVLATQDLAASWSDAAARGLVEGSLALLVLLVLWWPLRRRLSPRFVSFLFLLPLLKVAAPIAVPLPAWLQPFAVSGWWPVPVETFDSVLLGETVEGSAQLRAPGWHTSELASTESAPSALSADLMPVALGLRELLFMAWLLGAGLLAMRFARAQWRTRRLIHDAQPIDTTRFPVDLAALCRRAGVRRKVRFALSPGVPTPAAGGVLRPIVLLPVGFAGSLPPRQLTFVLLHELAHVRRHDLVVALLQRLVQIVWFFHPAVWLASRLIDQHRELACDQDALARSGASRRECGEAFLSVAAWVGSAPTPRPALVMFDATRVLRRRMMQILNQSPSRPSRLLTAAYLAFAAAVTLPSVKADAGVAYDTLSLVQQDEGQREEIEKLRKALAELKMQHAELSKQINKMHKAKAGQGKADAGGRVMRLRTRGDDDVDEVAEIEDVSVADESVVVRGLKSGDHRVEWRSPDGGHHVWVQAEEGKGKDGDKGKGKGEGDAGTFVLEGGKVLRFGKHNPRPHGEASHFDGGEHDVHVFELEGSDGDKRASKDGTRMMRVRRADGSVREIQMPDRKEMLEKVRARLKGKLPGKLQFDGGDFEVFEVHGKAMGDDGFVIFKSGDAAPFGRFEVDVRSDGGDAKDKDGKGNKKVRVWRVGGDEEGGDESGHEGHDEHSVDVRVEAPKAKVRKVKKSIQI